MKATGHAIEGLLALDAGEIRFDPDTGTASGQVSIDLRRAGTGNRLRDHEMHASVLETERYPVATFRPSRVIGSLAPSGPSDLVLAGFLSLHGVDHSRHPSRPGQGRRRYRLRRDHVRDSLRRLGAAQPEPPLPSRRARRRREPADRSEPAPRREIPMRSADVANAACFDGSAARVLPIGPGTASCRVGTASPVSLRQAPEAVMQHRQPAVGGRPSSQTDVFVVGGGPAGLAAAIAARQHGLDVTVADGAEPPIDRACGEGVMPNGVARIARVSVITLPAQAVHALPRHPLRRLRPLRRAPASGREAGRGVRRTTLHRLLLERAEALGVTARLANSGSRPDSAYGVALDQGSGRVSLDHRGRRRGLPRCVAGPGWARSPLPQRFGFRQHFGVRPWTDLGRGLLV